MGNPMAVGIAGQAAAGNQEILDSGLMEEPVNAWVTDGAINFCPEDKRGWRRKGDLDIIFHGLMELAYA